VGWGGERRGSRVGLGSVMCKGYGACLCSAGWPAVPMHSACAGIYSVQASTRVDRRLSHAAESARASRMQLAARVHSRMQPCARAPLSPTRRAPRECSGTRSTHASHALHAPTHSISRRAQLPPLHPSRSTSPTARARRPCPGTPPMAPSRRRSAPASTARCVGRGVCEGFARVGTRRKLCAAKRSHRMRMLPLEAATCSQVPWHPSHARASAGGGGC